VARPVVSAVAERVYEALGPFTVPDEAHGWALLKFVDALTQATADVDRFASDTDDGAGGTRTGWAILMDPDLCPAKGLPFLGQLVGVQVPVGADETTARAIVKAHGGWGRGTPAAITAAAKLTLTGAQHLTLTERDGSAYRVGVTTYAAETPDTAALQAAVNAALPAGLIATYTLLTGWLVSEMETEETAHTIAYLEANWATVAAFEAQLP
jgi:hypothetical protein